MPSWPRITRGSLTTKHVRTDEAKPVRVLLVLRWHGVVGEGAIELVPAYRLATAALPERPADIVLVQWWWEYGATTREDWFRAVDVLDHQPDAEEWAAIRARPQWLS